MLRPALPLTVALIVSFFVMTATLTDAFAEDLSLQLRFQVQNLESGRFQVQTRAEQWNPQQTAVIVCDVWDLHHCLNAVRRLEEFAPRLNEVLIEARRHGVTIIHAPSDCMDAYATHPARIRATSLPQAKRVPREVATWCSLIPAEARGTWPIDQSDGGEDDDPQEHAAWAAKLQAMGRHPGTPWARQSELISIDDAHDFISDRGDEVWNILESKGIRNVILTGVHTNMCVIGRPFGLRQMARNGKHVVLMRDMTDTMYNPRRWPYVSHFTGTDLVIAHIERFVCPTITSDQFLGGQPFRFKEDQRGQLMTMAASDTRQAADFAASYLAGLPAAPTPLVPSSDEEYWSPLTVPSSRSDTAGAKSSNPSVCWYRCTIRIPANWLGEAPLTFELDDDAEDTAGWLNGQPMATRNGGSNGVLLAIDSRHVNADDANLFVVRRRHGGGTIGFGTPPILRSPAGKLSLAGRWQFRLGDEVRFANMPLPAKFGTSSDIVFTPPEPRWQARPLTRPGDFTAGIEGPASDREGNVYAVNYARQGTIGRVLPNGAAEVFLELPAGSVGNGIRFAAEGEHFYVADYTQHNVLKVSVAGRKVTTLAHNDAMNQPNDLAIAPDGTLYASDPDWKSNTGQLWRIDADGTTTRLATAMGTTNGIEVSPDGKHLYVNESVQRNIWVFDITKERELKNKRLLKQFSDHGFDGMRCDVDGHLYVTRYGKGTVIKLSPAGTILQEIDVLGTRPSNLCFGGPDGRTVYVTEVDYQRIVCFRVDRPGRAWQPSHPELPVE